MYNQLSSFTNKHKLLYSYQFGFRLNHAPELALLCLVDKISDALENGEYVLGLFLDFSKAFDTVNHDILFAKLEFLGIRGVCLQWFISYLSTRDQYVVYNDTVSSRQRITCGVPQGSILGPLLFLLYINDLANASDVIFSLLFADDSNMFITGKNPDDLVTKMNADISDHYPIFCVNKTIKKETVTATISRRNFCKRNKNKFLQTMSDVDWSDIFLASDTQAAFTIFYRKLIKIHALCFPLETISKRYNTRKPWLSQVLRDSIKKKKKLYIKSIKHKCLHNETVYKNYRNHLKKLLKVAEKKYYSDLISKYKSDSKKVWSIIKTVINENKKNQLQNEFRLGDGSLTTDMKLICNKFNEFFINVGPSLSKKIPTQNTMPIDYIKNKAIYSMFLEPVSETEIKKLISSLKSNTPGYDMIGSAVLKWCVDSISEPLSYVCNMSLQEGLFPDELKIANVIPLYKCDDPKLFNNYQPVSVLPSVSKVFERIMYNRLVAYLNEYKILFSYQFGFRKQHSTYMALMTLIDKLTKCLDNDEYVIGFFLDISKAFDTVDHTILLQKLSVYGIRGNALSWFESYMKDRRQFVTYNGVLSETKILQCGVPQGSILGPLLFLIYINDLANVCTSSFPILFADDTNLFNHGKDMFSLQASLNQELANISQWLKVNKLSLNIKRPCTWCLHERKHNLRILKLKLTMRSSLKRNLANSWECILITSLIGKCMLIMSQGKLQGR